MTTTPDYTRMTIYLTIALILALLIYGAVS